MEVKPRRVGGATYQVPMEVPTHRQFALATRWIIASSRARSGKSFSEKLAGELLDAANNAGFCCPPDVKKPIVWPKQTAPFLIIGSDYLIS